MRVSIEVTENDIATAQRACPTHCMVAKTLSRVLRDDVEIYVTVGITTLRRGGCSHAFMLDPALGAKILQFDLGLPVRDFAYSIDIPVVFLKDTVIGYYLLMEDNDSLELEVDIPDVITVPGPPDNPQPALPERELVPA